MIEFDEIQMPKNTSFLIVEDESDIAEIIEVQLKEMKFTGSIYKVDSFEKAKHILSNNTVTFIISDWNLEGLTGLDLLKYIRTSEALKETPFLMLTGNSDIDEMLRATEEGTSDYLVKPWTEKELQHKIFNAWEVHN